MLKLQIADRKLKSAVCNLQFQNQNPIFITKTIIH